MNEEMARMRLSLEDQAAMLADTEADQMGTVAAPRIIGNDWTHEVTGVSYDHRATGQGAERLRHERFPLEDGPEAA